VCCHLKARCAPACCEDVSCCGAVAAPVAPAAAPIPAPPAPKK
jgi:hypothetical protein